MSEAVHERRRWPWIVAVAVLALAVLGLVGNELRDVEAESSSEPGGDTRPVATAAPTTTSTPARTTAAPTTTAAPVTTASPAIAEPGYHDAACSSALQGEADMMSAIDISADLVREALTAYDDDEAQSWWTLMRAQRQELERLRLRTDHDCEHDPRRADVLRIGVRQHHDDLLRELDDGCRKYLAPNGFDC